ncbi:helix-turn-helix domain-containing protein [Arthrobacter sp. TMN-50]
METKYAADVERILSRPTATVGEAGQVLGLGRQAAYAAVRTGQIRSLRIGRKIIVPTKALVNMLEGQPQDAA